MRKHFAFLLKYYLFWLIYFILAKLFFLIFIWNELSEISVIEIYNVFHHGLIMDISTSSYFLILINTLFLFLLPFSVKAKQSFIATYNSCLIIIISLLSSIDIVLYPHWGIRLSFAIFNYICEIEAISASTSILDLIKGIFIWGFFSILFIVFQKKYLKYDFQITRRKWLFPILVLTINAFLIIPIRGGFNTSPLNLSSVSFSPKLILNQAARNFLWNFGRTIEKKKQFTNPCQYMELEQSLRIFNEFKSRNKVDQRPQLINYNDSTNVVFIILESISNKVIPPLGGKYNVCPNLDSLCQESIAFDSFYASGNRSDRGISAILGGYPSLLSTSIMRYPSKVDKLKLLSQYFVEHNYNTYFYYGGDINFFDLKNFALKGGVKNIVSRSDFPSSISNMSKWGAPDEYLFKRVFVDMEESKQPYLKIVYTLSSHSPYDVPFHKIRGNTIDERYLNSVAYTDSCLGAFVNSIKASTLWKNTLLIITADHGAPQPGNTEITKPETYQIPMLWTGGVIKKPMRINQIGMQPDLIPTLINQFHWEMEPSKFGNDIFSSKPYAFYMMDFGWGYITPEGSFFFDQNKMNFTTFKKESNDEPDFSFAKAYMQQLHEDFIKK